ncbi:hypothetical protein D3C72_2246130 [compost metagenome]
MEAGQAEKLQFGFHIAQAFATGTAKMLANPRLPSVEHAHVEIATKLFRQRVVM